MQQFVLTGIISLGLGAGAWMISSKEEPEQTSVSSSSSSQSLDYISGNSSGTEKYRVVWVSDPTTQATIAWNQKDGAPGLVHYGKVDQKRHHGKYEKSQKTDRVQDYHGMKNCFVRLKGLEQNTEYFFVVKDEKGVSRRMKFTTASNTPKAFTFLAGGDSRNVRAARQSANLMASKLKPLFIAFTGDMISRDNEKCWTAWFDDWQQTIAKDGSVIPIVAHRGNHEGRPDSIYSLFDTNKDAYFSFSIGGDLFRYYVLNSMLPADGAQGRWLTEDLKANHKKYMHLAAGYHHPMRPHVKGKREGKNPYKWAKTFYKYGLDLALESDSHVLKRTLPLKPDMNGEEGFVAVKGDKNATVYSGEGCWGAPLRPANDAKSWTLDCLKSNGFDWIRVSPENLQLKTVLVKDVAKAGEVDKKCSFETPKGVTIWKAKGGEVMTIATDR